MRRSKMLAKLRAGQFALTTNISLSMNPLAVELAGRSGIDGMWLDTEHRPFTQREVSHMLTASRVADIDVFVRIRKGEGYTAFFRPLEDGAAGICVPHVATEEEARWVARNAKYPPIGRRGFENVMPDADLGFADSIEYIEHANRETFVMIQIEDVEALDHLDAILAVDGIDLCFVGPADLTLSMGIPLQTTHERYLDALKQVAAAAERHGVWWGLPVPSVEAARTYADMGARYFNIGSDYRVLRAHYAAVRAEFNNAFGNA